MGARPVLLELEHPCVVAPVDHGPCRGHLDGGDLIYVCLIGAESASASSSGAGGGENGCGGCDDVDDLNLVQKGMQLDAMSELVRAFWLIWLSRSCWNVGICFWDRR